MWVGEYSQALVQMCKLLGYFVCRKTAKIILYSAIIYVVDAYGILHSFAHRQPAAISHASTQLNDAIYRVSVREIECKKKKKISFPATSKRPKCDVMCLCACDE